MLTSCSTSRTDPAARTDSRAFRCVVLAAPITPGPASLSTSALDAVDEGLIGVVAGGSTGTAVVVLRQVDAVLGQPLTLTVEQPAGRGRITLDRGIVLR